MSTRIPKLVDNPHYHLWTDALHIRALSHQAKNKWDRGTYVRLTIITAWTVLEIACQDALEEPSISYSFKRNLDDAVSKRSLPKLDWSQGVWQEVIKVQEVRKNYVHRFISERDLFPEVSLADDTIEAIRNAIQAIYIHTGKIPPKWVEDDEDRGWDSGRGSFGHSMTLNKDVDENAPDTIKIAIVMEGKEFDTEVLAAGTDPEPFIEQILQRTRLPISAIKVYQGDSLIKERALPMRGT